MRFPNRFTSLSYIDVHSLRISFFAGCLFNLFLFSLFLLVGGLFFYFASSSVSSDNSIVVSTVPPLPAVLPTLPPVPSSTVFPTLAPAPSATWFPTVTPPPTVTPFPTSTPWPTATPFTFSLVIALPSPSPTRHFSMGELLAGAPTPVLVSEYKYAFYRGLCLSGQPRIEPRVFGLPEIVSGLHWKLWNNYGFSLDTSEYEQSYTDDTTLYLSSDPSLFHLALFYFDQQISDEVNIDYPGSCTAVQIIYGVSARATWSSVTLPDGQVLSQTEVISVSVSPR